MYFWIRIVDSSYLIKSINLFQRIFFFFFYSILQFLFLEEKIVTSIWNLGFFSKNAIIQ